ncbi:MAG: hypothetical protein JXR77_06055 [Lentisphaeria bacterium]|nr:hypothetical protein [Lentisphaeria bacterium]
MTRALRGRSRAIWVWASVVLCAFVCGACVSTSSTEQSDRDIQPWNQPAGWEGSILGVPY